MTITLEQKQARKYGIGGSDAGVILGVNPYKTARELFLEKREEIPCDFDDNEKMMWGNELEPVIAREYARRTGHAIKPEPKTLKHPKHDFILGHVDFLIEDEIRGLEVKNVGWRMAEEWGENGSDEIPFHYIAQTAHYALVTGIEVWDFAVLIGGQELRILTAHISDRLKQNLLNAELEFWDRVQRNDPPPVDGNRLTPEQLKRIYRGDNGQAVHCTPEMLNLVRRLKDYKANKKVCEELIAPVETEIKVFMGENSVLEDENGSTLCTWKKRKDKKAVDWEGAFKEFREIAPVLDKEVNAIIKKHTTNKPGSRTFLVK